MKEEYVTIFAVIPKEIYQTKDLSPEDKLIAERLVYLCKKEGYSRVTNKALADMYGIKEDSAKVKKETLDCMNQVIKDAKKIEEMQPRMESTFKSMKNFSDTLSETSKENVSLNKEVDNLKLRNKILENQIGRLKETIDYLQAIIEAIIEFVY